MRLLWLLAMVGWVCAEEKANSRLLMTQVIWSHGSATPARIIPADDGNDEESWTEGLASLTHRGRSEALKLGALLNARYVGSTKLLHESNAQRSMYVRAADCNRTLTSAYALLAALLPMPPAQLGSRDWPLYWLPFPVHSVPAQHDGLLNPSAPCPVIDERIPAKLVESPAFRDESNLQFLEFILKKSGFGELTWDTLYDIYAGLQAVQSGAAGNHSFPLWMDGEGFARLRQLVDFSAAAAYADPTVAKLKGGPLLKEMLERMQTKARCQSDADAACRGISELRFYGYSADPLTLHALLHTLGHVSGALPGHAAALALELWHGPELGYEVRALYHDGLGDDPTKLREFTVSDCPELNCTLEAFAERSAPVVPWNWERECGILTKGLSPECEAEQDNSEQQSCQDWARHGLCDQQPAVRFVFCRRTCLCNSAFAKKTRKFRLV